MCFEDKFRLTCMASHAFKACLQHARNSCFILEFRCYVAKIELSPVCKYRRVKEPERFNHVHWRQIDRGYTKEWWWLMKDLKALALCIIFEGYVGTETFTRQRSYSCCSIHLRLICTSLPLLLGYNYIINTCIKLRRIIKCFTCFRISDFLLYTLHNFSPL